MNMIVPTHASNVQRQVEPKVSIHSLPLELLLQIFSTLGVRDLAHVRMSCKEWRVFAQYPCVWEAMAKSLQWQLKDSDPPYEKMQEFLYTQWLAEKKNDPEALEKIGTWYLRGTRSKRETKEAYAYLEKAARLGNGKALSYFQEIFSNFLKSIDREDRVKYSEVYRRLRALSVCVFNENQKKCSGDAYHFLGKEYLFKIDGQRILERSYEKALDYFKRAAEKDHIEALQYFQTTRYKINHLKNPRELASVHLKLSRMSREQLLMAISFYNYLCDQKGYESLGNYFLGKLYTIHKGPFFDAWTHEQCDQMAFVYFQRGAALNSEDNYQHYQSKISKCQFMLGKFYFEGRGIGQSYKRAAKIWNGVQGVQLQWVHLGELHENGWGVKQSHQKAYELYEEFADVHTIGDFHSKKSALYIVKALERLGYLSQDGLGVEKNEKKAQEYFQKARKAQEKIQRMARGVLGKLTEKVFGQKIKKDFKK
jgi:TPR repeat protein